MANFSITKFPNFPILRACLVASLVVWSLPVTAQEPSLDAVLARATAYVADFKRQLSGIVAEETYIQHVTRQPSVQSRGEPDHRELRSDFLLVQADDVDGYEEFRDVFEVDGQSVRDRQERLTELFIDQGPSATQLQQIRAESARYNIGRFQRNINTPTLALLFLNPAHRSRFRFSRSNDRRPRLANENERRSDSAPMFTVRTDVWVIEYRETGRRTLIRTPQGRDVQARGRFWIDPATGQPLMTEIVVDEPGLRATIDVRYETMPFSSLAVAVEMRERYELRNMTITGTATYSNFRQFAVNVSETIADPTR